MRHASCNMKPCDLCLPEKGATFLKCRGDELEFYAKLQSAAKKADSWAAFAAMAMSCPGVARLDCVNPKSQERSKRQILLLENLRQGFPGTNAVMRPFFFWGVYPKFKRWMM